MHGILGQQRAIDLLQQSLASERMHHAWIFAGPQGIGKYTTAIELAKILLDPAAQPNFSGVIEAEPGGEVSRLVDSETHPDLHIIRKELARHSDSRRLRNAKQTNIAVDVLRQFMIGGTIQETDAYFEPVVSHSPKMGVGKVFIIDEAQLLDTTGQNALLKTLEEPPQKTSIILITDQPEGLTATIRSRCQLLRFDPLDDDAMNQWFNQSGLDVTPAERNWITSFSEGSPGMATVAATYGFFQWSEALAPMLHELACGRYSAELGPALAGCVDDYANAWVKGEPNRSKDAANKAGFRHILRILSAYTRERIETLSATGDPDVVGPWLGVVDVLRDAEQSIRSNVNMKLVLENIVAQWTSTLRERNGLHSAVSLR